MEPGGTHCRCYYSQHDFKKKIFSLSVYVLWRSYWNFLKIKGTSTNLAAMGFLEKNNFLREHSRYHHKNKDEQDNFYSLQHGSGQL